MTPSSSREPQKAIAAALREHTPRLMALPGVVSVAEGRYDGSPCIRVLVIRKTRELLEQIPPAIEGYAVQIDESGEVRARNQKKRA